MRKFRKYIFKKIYLDEPIFEIESNEIKAGYLNINGLMDGGHADYLNADLNLSNLDILVLAETKLDDNCESDQVIKILTNWKMIGRYDAEDGSKHMGLMFLTSKKSAIIEQVQSVTHQTLKRVNSLQVQGLIVRLTNGDNYGFVYCRTTPINPEIKAICKHFDECHILMGDFNLSHRIIEDQAKIENLCQGNKVNALKEITRSMSNNQLEYILIDERFKDNYFVTSYNNFISDHKSIVARMGENGNKLKQDIKERITFDQESHLKQKRGSQDPHCNLSKSKSTMSNIQQNTREEYDQNKKTKQTKNQTQMENTFKRRFENPDMTTCWLNSCLQLILTAIDYDEFTITRIFSSELGRELLKLHFKSGKEPLDPSIIKDIIVTSEDTRIAMRLSELSYEIINQRHFEEQSMQIRNLRLDLRNGQQCVRDFFLCINENLVNWPDVHSTFALRLTHSSECSTCKHRNEFETTQLYVEIPVPPNNSDLKEYIEDSFSERSNFGGYCDGSCNAFSEKSKWTSITNTDEAKFLIVILTRGIVSMDGFQLVKNQIKSTDDIDIR